MAKQSSVNLDITNNSNGFDISGGTTSRTLGISGGNVTIVGSGSATLTFPTTSDTLVGRATTDTLTNKTLTSPVISTITNSGTITLPTSTDTLVGRATTDTLTNKTLTSPVISTITNVGTLTLPSDTTRLVGRTTTDTLTNKTLTSPVISTITNTGTLTLPTSTDTLVGRATTDTLTNKTLTSPVISTITNTGTITLPSDTTRLVGRTTTDTLTNKTLTSPVISTITNTGTITLPTSTDTLVGRATTDTLTNKTLTSPVISTITNTGTITLPTTTGTLALLGANTFTGLQTFSAGITSTTLYASAGVTFNSRSAFTGLATFNAGISASGATFSGNITAPNIVTGISGATGPINLVAGTNITIAQSGKTFTFSSSGGGTQVGVTSSGQLFDVDTWAFSYCDFHGGPGPFGTILGASGGDVIYYIDSPATHLFTDYTKYTGLANLRTGATGSYVALGCATPSATYTTAVGAFSMANAFEFRTRISSDNNSYSTATNTFIIYAGVDEQVALYPTFNTFNGAAFWFEYNYNLNSGNWTTNFCEYFGRTASTGTTFAYSSDCKMDIIKGSSGGVGYIFMHINGVTVSGYSYDAGLVGVQPQGNARIVVRRTTSAATATRRTFVDYLSILQRRG